MADVIQIHSLTPYAPGNLVRGLDGRPKMALYGGVDRGRISSAALKRAIRTSERFHSEVGTPLGLRTALVGDHVRDALIDEGIAPAEATRAAREVASAFGKVVDDAQSAATKQMAFVTDQELQGAVTLALKIVRGEVNLPKADSTETSDEKKKRKRGPQPQESRDAILGDLLHETVEAIDVGLFGRFFADRNERTMTAAASVAHAITVGKAKLETDFYVAVDDKDQNASAQFMGEQYFTSGLFYGYAAINMDQLTRNLGGDADAARRGAAAFIRGMLTVSPRGKHTTYGTNSMAVWAMVERRGMPLSLAGAFLKPVSGEDQFTEAVRRAESFAASMDRVYGLKTSRRIMNAIENPDGAGCEDLLGIVDARE